MEQTPPTFHLLSRSVIYTPGEHHVTVRLPSILAVGVLGICLFIVVSRRTSTAFGLNATVFPLLTQAFPSNPDVRLRQPSAHTRQRFHAHSGAA